MIAVWVAVVGVVLFGDRAGSCDVLSERGVFGSVSDVDESDPRPTIEEAVEDAFADAGTPREVDAKDLDPIILPGEYGNVVNVGIDGYWVMIATVQGGDAFVWIAPPRPCSILERPA